jgi:putative ABC transport system permease protein
VSNSEPLLMPTLVIVCVVMAVAAGLVSRLFLRGSLWPAPTAGMRAAVQLAAVATVLAAAMSRLWSSMLVLAVMFMVASVTAARRSETTRGSVWLAAALATGMAAVIPLLLLSRIVPLSGVALVGVLLATGSAVQVLVLVALLLSQACGVAVTGELVARGWIVRAGPH